MDRKKTIQDYFTSGPSKGKPKRLLEIARELKISLHENIELEELQEFLGRYKILQNIGKSLATVYNIIAP